MACTHLSTTEILDHIFEASTLEEAIRWRRIMLGRLKMVLTHAFRTDISEDEIKLYVEAATELELALTRLEIALAAGERLDWSSGRPVPEWHPRNN
jgi:uncharacterized protein YjaG (DUF416 family)